MDTGYDFSNPSTVALLSKTYKLSPEQLGSINTSYKTQYGNNIGDQALMRAASEAQGNYLWGAPSSGTVPAGATVSDPTAKITTDTGVYQGGGYTPNANVAAGSPGSVAVAPNAAYTAPLNNNPVSGVVTDGSPKAYAAGLAAGTNGGTQTGTTGGASGGTNTGGTSTGGTTSGGTSTGTGQSPIDIYNGALSSLGITDARSRVSNLRAQLINTENLIKGVDASVTGRTQNSLVTEAQRQRLVASEKAPLNDLYTTQTQASGLANADLQDILGQAKTQADYTVEGNQQAEAIRQFNVTQAESKRQFEAQLALDVKRLDLSKEQQAEAIRQFNTQQALEVERFRQSQNEFTANNANTLSQQNFTNNLALQDLALKQKEAETSRINATKSGSGGKTTVAEQKANDQSAANDDLLSKVGGDGYVSPDTYKAVRQNWINAGYSAGSFETYFKTYINPSHPEDYK